MHETKGGDGRLAAMRAAMIVAVAMLAGCSAIAARGPHTRITTGEVVCDATYVPPIVDAAIATAAGVLAVWGLTDADTGETDGHTLTLREVVAAPSFGAMLVFGLSTGYGFSKVARCRNAARASATTATIDDQHWR